MSNIKERLMGAIAVMDDISAHRLWDFVLELSGQGWSTVEEVEPDSIDLQMIQEANSDPDCHSF